MTTPDLRYVDAHTLTVTGPPARVWPALLAYVEELLAATERNPLSRVLGPSPAAGFAVEDSRPQERLVLAGHHRFSRYRLVFDLTDVRDGTTEVRATTWADFPGPHGRVYRALVVGTGLHVVATRRLLRGVERRAG